MIVFDESDTTVKSQQRVEDRVQALQNDGENIPPPAYSGPSSNTSALHIAAHANDSLPLLRAGYDYAAKEPTSRRFMKAFAAALLIYAFLALFARGIFMIARYEALWSKINHDEVGWPLEDDGKLLRCVRGREQWLWHGAGAPYSASFELPLSAEQVILTSRGRLSKGRVHIIQDPSWTKPNTAAVNISLLYPFEALWDRMSVCMLDLDGASVVGLYTPNRWPALFPDVFEFNVTIRLPISEDHTPLHIPSLVTNVPNFSQFVDDLAGNVTFGLLNLWGSNGPVAAQSVSAGEMSIMSRNGPIEGTFYASEFLSLVTSDSHIKADVHITAHNSNTALHMKTSNGALDSSVSLASASPGAAGDSFIVSAQTSNAPLTLAFPQSPLDARLTLRARTSNAPAAASLHRAYEGSFKLRTTNGRMAVPFDQNAHDPTGSGRTRQLSLSQSERLVTGSVSWGEADTQTGSVEVESTNGPVTLNLV